MKCQKEYTQYIPFFVDVIISESLDKGLETKNDYGIQFLGSHSKRKKRKRPLARSSKFPAKTDLAG